MRYTLDVFVKFLKTVDLESYRERFTHISQGNRTLFTQGVKRSELAKMFNISWRHAADIVSFKTRRGKAVKIPGPKIPGHRPGVSCEFF